MSSPPSLPIDPDSLLLSPPNAKSAVPNPIHAFFTPRRAPLSNITSSSNNCRTRTRAQLPSPGDSPSYRASKRPRLSSSPVPHDDELDFRKRVRRVQQPVETVPDLPLPEPRKRVRPTTSRRLLMRSMDGLSSRGATYAAHCADWKTETTGFYSTHDYSYGLLDRRDYAPIMPFATAACNRNSLVAIGDEFGVVHLVDAAKGGRNDFSKTYLRFCCHGQQPVFNLSWSRDDYQIATASGDQTARVFDVVTRKCLYVLCSHTQSVKQVSHHPLNPSLLTSCSRDGSIRLWDIRISGTKSPNNVNEAEQVTYLKPVATVEGAYAERKKAGCSVTSAIWLTEDRIASASEGNTRIKVWDLRSIQNPRKTPQPVVISGPPDLQNQRQFGMNSLNLSPDGTRLYGLCRDSKVYAYSTSNLEHGPIHAYSHPRLHASTFYVKSAISPDGRLLATGSSDGIVAVFPTDECYFDKSKYRNYSSSETLRMGRGSALVRGHDKEVTDITWTAEGSIASISDDYHARCWLNDANRAEELREGGEDEGRRWQCGWAEA